MFCKDQNTSCHPPHLRTGPTRGRSRNCNPEPHRASLRTSSAQQESYLQLHGYLSDLPKVAVKYDTKRVGQELQELPELHRKVLSNYAAKAFGCVFFLSSRINLSCVPNVNFVYNELLKEDTLHVIRAFMGGEELTVMYIDGINRTQS